MQSFFEFGFLDFHLDSIEFLKCMIWQSNFSFCFLCFFFCFFLCSHELSTSGDDACHRWPSRLKHHFSCGIVLKMVAFWSKGCSYHFCQQEKGYGSKVFSRHGQFSFWSTCPKASIKDDFEILWSCDLYSWLLKRSWQAWSCSKSWRIPNIKSYKNSSFFVAWFLKSSRKRF